MLPKANRLKTEDFKTLRNMRTSHTPHFLLRVESTQKSVKKVAVIVSSATYKKAVDRNLLRRRVYHIIAKHDSMLSLRTATITIKKGTLTVSFKELEQELLSAFAPYRPMG